MAEINGTFNEGWYEVPLEITSSGTGVKASIPNPFEGKAWINHLVLEIVTGSGSASTLDIGPAANTSTSNDTLIDGLSGATPGIYHSKNDTDNGTNGVAAGVELAADGFINIAVASGNGSGLVAKVKVKGYKL